MGSLKEELYNLDCSLARHILPRLIAFREVACSYPKVRDKDAPAEITDGLERWLYVLDEMIFAMDKAQDVTWKDGKRINRGLMLFGRYFRYLWL